MTDFGLCVRESAGNGVGRVGGGIGRACFKEIRTSDSSVGCGNELVGGEMLSTLKRENGTGVSFFFSRA